MDHPYQPPAAESPGSAEPRRSRDAKARRAALILACAAMLVGSGLLYFFAGRGGFDLLGDLSLQAVPPWYRGILRTKPEVPIFVGMTIALFTVLFALSPLTRIAVALGFLAVSIIGAWAAVLFWVLMNLLRPMAGN